MKRYSRKCHDLKTHWDRNKRECVACRNVIPGHEMTPNCGYDDNGGIHEGAMTKCKENFFNDGSSEYCQPCTSCPAGLRIVNNCNSTTDTQCQDPIIKAIICVLLAKQGSNLRPDATNTSHAHVLWTVPFAITISIVLVLSACIYKKRKQGPEIVSAPLQTVLDNLDVLEELIILLDPESHCVKYTKHLATHCSFSSTWITYTYSMRDRKSPLKAVLEGVTSRNPDWTVGHLAKMLRQMDRNDAVFALSKLKFNQIDCL
ncbi:hypothetical protein PAMP_002449 [Pampus punctatissimus]